MTAGVAVGARPALAGSLSPLARSVQPARVSADGEVEFEDGTSQRVDAILFATGYRYWFPFLPASLVGADTDTHACPAVKPLYRQLWHAEEPTLGFLALPYKIAPFRLAEIQAHAFARSLTGDAPERLPGREERVRDARQLAAAVGRGVPEHHLHVLGEEQWPYSRCAQVARSLLSAAAVGDGTPAGTAPRPRAHPTSRWRGGQGTRRVCGPAATGAHGRGHLPGRGGCEKAQSAALPRARVRHGRGRAAVVGHRRGRGHGNIQRAGWHPRRCRVAQWERG